METLIKGRVYNMRVKSINENYDQFESAAGIKHCHQFTLIMDFDEYDCQICSSNKMQGYCQVGDWVNISVSKFTKNQYTLEKIEVDHGSVSYDYDPHRSESIPADMMKDIRETGSKVVPLPKQEAIFMPASMGTEAETAIAVSAKFHAINSRMPGTPLITVQKEVIDDAEIIYQWLMDKKKNP
jgi:hypothetical protein